MEKNKINSILFFGAGEVAELAYLYLQFTDIQLVGIVDDGQNGNDFFEFRIEGVGRLERKDWDTVLVTRLDDTERDIRYLSKNGADLDRVETL
jgi:hypothetical protein